MQRPTKDVLALDDVQVDLPGHAPERCALAAEVLRTSGRLRLQVRGESMLPTLWPGDMVEIRSCAIDQVLPGEIVLAMRDDRFFLHRFAGRSARNGFQLRGDSMPRPDPLFPNEALLGRLASCAREGRLEDVRFRLPLQRWSRAIGRLLCYCGPARRLALTLHERRKRNVRVVQSGQRASSAAVTQLGPVQIEAPDAGVS